MNTLASAIKTIVRPPSQSPGDFFQQATSACDLTVVIGPTWPLTAGPGRTIRAASIDSGEVIAAVKKAKPQNIGIRFSEEALSTALNCHNIEESISKAPSALVSEIRDQYTRLLNEAPFLAQTMFHAVLNEIEDCANSVALVLSSLPTTVHIPHYYVKTFSWEKPKDLEWSIPRAIARRVLLEMDADDSKRAQPAAPKALPPAPATAAALRETLAPTARAPKAPASAPAPAQAPASKMTLADLPNIRPLVQQTNPREAIKIGDFLAIHREHPLHDTWAEDFPLDGRIFHSVTHYMAYRKVKFFNEPLDDTFFDTATVLQCLRMLLPDDRHSLETQRTWGRERLDAFRVGTQAKLKHCKSAADALEATGTQPLLFLSRDRKLGIGFDDPNEDPKSLVDRYNWRGGNGAGLFLEGLQPRPEPAPAVPPRKSTPSTAIVRKVASVIPHQQRVVAEDESDFTDEDLARLSGKLPVRLTRYQDQE